MEKAKYLIAIDLATDNSPLQIWEVIGKSIKQVNGVELPKEFNHPHGRLVRC